MFFFSSISKNVTVDDSPYRMPAEEATGILKHVSLFLAFLALNFKIKSAYYFPSTLDCYQAFSRDVTVAGIWLFETK